MQEDLATITSESGADCPVEIDSISPGLGVVVAHIPPVGVRVEGAGQMLIDGLWLPARIGEDRTIGHGADLAVCGHQGDGSGLDAGAKTEDAQADGFALRRWGRRANCGKCVHHAASRSSSMSAGFAA